MRVLAFAFDLGLRARLTTFPLQGVGKSCLIHRYVKGHFDKDSKITIGAAFLSHTVNLRDEGTVKPVKFEIWDTAGAVLAHVGRGPVPAWNV